MLQIHEGRKPANAGWRAKATVWPNGTAEAVADPHYANFPHDLDQVEVAWYDDRVKVTFKGGGPALVSQMYLSGKGKSVIIELMPAEIE